MTFDEAVELLDAKLPAGFSFDLQQQAGRHSVHVISPLMRQTTLEVRSEFSAKRFPIEGPDFAPAARAGIDWAMSDQQRRRDGAPAEFTDADIPF